MNQAGAQWELRGGEYHCHRHPDVVPFGRGEVCPLCVADPGEPVDIVAEAVVDREAIAAEVELRAFARRCKSVAEELIEEGTAQDKSVGAKFGDLYLKAMRSWREMRTERLNVARDFELVQHDREMSGLRGSH